MLRRLLSAGIVAALTALLAGAATAAERGPYAPENIESTEKGFYWVCMVKAICPVSDKVLDLVKGVVARNRSAEYLLGLTLMVGDDLSPDPDIGLLWIVRAAERGEPTAARDITERLHAGAAIDVDNAKVADALKAQADAGDAESMRALGPMMIAGRGIKRDAIAGVALLRRAAEKGSSGAEKDLAQLYPRGAAGVREIGRKP
jgi:Sel1 repeat-containing protein